MSTYTYFIVLGHMLSPTSKMHNSSALSLMCLLLVITTVAVVRSYEIDSSLIVRQHYGVAFKPTETFRPVGDHWIHTFGFTLPPHPTVNSPRKINCLYVTPGNRTHCIRMKPYVDTLALLQFNMSKQLVKILREIDRTIPNRVPPPSRSRSARSWFPFLGDVFHTVTGTVTEDELSKALKLIDDIRKTQVTAFHEWSKGEIILLVSRM